MLSITIRSDNPDAELGLYDDQTELAYTSWLAHRQLAETIHQKLDELLKSQGKTLHDVQGIVVFKGPGSFTGLRIGITVANTLAYGLSIPIVSADGDKWRQQGLERLLNGESEPVALPEYGAEPHITVQKK